MEDKKLLESEKDLIVKIEDVYGDACLMDRMQGNERADKDRKNPQGFVEIFECLDEHKAQLVGKHNLVVYLGRQWLAVRALKTPYGNITATYNEFITWFGVGDGGTLPGDPFDPVSPANENTDLNNAVSINATDATCADFYDGAYHKHPFDNIQYEQDPENSNAWLLGRVVTTLGSDDANGHHISEAGLFTAESGAGGYTGPFHLFSRVTFPTIVKNTNRQLIFVWYLYF